MSTRLRSMLLIAVATIAMAVVLMPTPVHAADNPVGEVLVSFGAGFIEEIMDVVISMLGVADQVIGKVISWGGQAISAAIGMEINYGGAAVYQVWKIFRDICNGLFIVLFIFVAFGTIFNVVWKNPFYYQSALKNVIVAALLINFSLPIGQLIIWAGNKATALVNSTMGEVDVAATILSRGKLPQVMVGHNNALSLSQVPMTNVDDAKLNAVQLLAKQGVGEIHDAMLQDCRNSGKYDLAECIARVARIEAAEAQKKYEQATLEPGLGAAVKRTLSDTVLFWGNAAKGAARGAAGGVTGGVSGVLIGAAEGAWSGASFTPPTEDPSLDVEGKGLLILSKMVNLFFKGVVALSFLVVIIFMFARLPVVWFYLAMSALAFFSIGVPGTKTYKEWLNNMIGWNIFAPLYLFVIYIGMMVLNNDTALLDGLSGAGAFAGIVGMALFYVLAGGIFLIGAKMAWTYAFLWSSSLGTQVTKYADMLGVSEKSNFGASTLAGKLGITAQYKARKAQVQQFGGDIAAGMRGRAPTLFRSEAESEAYRKMKLGVRGAGAELDVLAKKRIDAQKTILDERVERLDPKEQVKYLQSQLRSGNRDVALAAGEILLKKGKLDPAQRTELLTKYGSISPIARKKALERIVEQYKKEEYKTVKDAIDALDAVREDGKAYSDVLKAIEKNQPLMYAKLADATLVQDEKGNRLKMSDVLEQKASKLSDAELLELYRDDKLKNLGKNLNYVWESKLKNQKDLQGLLRTADEKTRARLGAQVERSEQEARAPRMAEEAVQRRQEQEALGEKGAIEIESALRSQIDELNAQGRAAAQQYREARDLLAKDSTNRDALKAATDAQNLINRIASQRNQLKAKLGRGSNPPTP